MATRCSWPRARWASAIPTSTSSPTVTSSPSKFPIIPGHEWSGEVVAVGPEVRNVRPGDRIVGECTVNGGADHFGFSISGAAAERFKIRSDWAHRLPDELSWQQGATVEPFSCAFHAIRRLGGIQPGDDVAVIGGGPIGLSAVAASVALGGRTLLIEPLEHRRRLGRDSGPRTSSTRPSARRAISSAS